LARPWGRGTTMGATRADKNFDDRSEGLRMRFARACAAAGTVALVAGLPAAALVEDAPDGVDGRTTLEVAAEVVGASGTEDGDVPDVPSAATSDPAVNASQLGAPPHP